MADSTISVDTMRQAIRAATVPSPNSGNPRLMHAQDMTRDQKLRLIFKWTHSDFKSRPGYVPTLMLLRSGGSTLVPLSMLTDEEIESRLPYALKKDAERKEALARVRSSEA